MPVYAMRDTRIFCNDRICQFRIVENQPKIIYEEMERLDETDQGGFGSIGKQVGLAKVDLHVDIADYSWYTKSAVYKFPF